MEKIIKPIKITRSNFAAYGDLISTNDINPIWEWGDPSNMVYSGIIIDEDENGNIEQDIFYNLIQNNIQPSDTLFDPKWQNINYKLPSCVCDNLKLLYPNGEFYFGLEIENLECDFCVIVDNIEVNITDCSTQKEITLTNCLIPELSCVIDNKKSWVYDTGGVEYQTIYPDGECNTGSTNNYEITNSYQQSPDLYERHPSNRIIIEREIMESNLWSCCNIL